ncbi:hypothetical protein EON83_29500 [bacterium]|nr:MAG: hypothetical protein EON83_29500 [bacterium]
MESENLKEQIKRESYRIATAFGVKRIGIGRRFSNIFEFRGPFENDEMVWSFLKETGQLIGIRLGYKERCGVHRMKAGRVLNQWLCVRNSMFNEQMARGLYRFGFEDETIIDQLHPLTAHEKLELRLSMPREFWPQKWLNEEK